MASRRRTDVRLCDCVSLLREISDFFNSLRLSTEIMNDNSGYRFSKVYIYDSIYELNACSQPFLQKLLMAPKPETVNPVSRPTTGVSGPTTRSAIRSAQQEVIPEGKSRAGHMS